MKNYSVSLVYIKNTPSGITHALRVSIKEAVSKEEALGAFIVELNDEMTDYLLACKVVLEILINNTNEKD